jgi:putative ATPase
MSVALPGVELAPKARDALVAYADGDGRRLINLVEQLSTAAGKSKATIDLPFVETTIARSLRRFDKGGEAFYDQISALHKSVRGSDPDAALYWLARMLAGGEDPLFIARRLIRAAAEDIGEADPMSLVLANAAKDTYDFLGSPEGEIALAQLVVHLAAAPKSNAVYMAFGAAMKAAKETGSLMPPAHIRNAPTKLMKDLGYGKGYRYDHDAPEGFSGQNYFPDGMARQQFYKPRGEGSEARIKERLERWAALRRDKDADSA